MIQTIINYCLSGCSSLNCTLQNTVNIRQMILAVSFRYCDADWDAATLYWVPVTDAQLHGIMLGCVSAFGNGMYW